MGALVQVVPNLPSDQEVILIGTEGEVDGKDSHLTTTGLPAMLFADDPTKGLETIQVGGKTFAHGPSASLNAPDDKWYLIDSGSGFSMTISPMQLLDKAAEANGNWSRFHKTKGALVVNSKNCDTYSADSNAVADTFAAMTKDNFPPTVVESGNADVSICDDGYIHNMTLGVQAHDQSKPDTKGTLAFTLHLYDYDAPIAIQAPSDAVAAAGNQGPAPTTAPASPTPQPDQGSQVGPADYNGSWQGTNSADTPINFEIENNKVTMVNLNYTLQVGDCSLSGGISRSVDNPTSISNGTFTVQIDDSDGRQMIFVGKLSSSSDASGTLQVKGVSDTCGAYDDSTNWTAKKDTATTQGAGAAPTDVPTSEDATPTSSDSEIVQSFFDHLNAQDIDGALGLVDDNVVYTFGPNTGIGTDDLRTYLESLLSASSTYVLSNVSTDPASVDLDVTVDGANMTGSAILEGGKIVIVKLQ